MSHTPGPWVIDNRMVLGRAFDGSWKALVDRVRGGSPVQSKANAHLIAAAPEMLAALKLALTSDNSQKALDAVEAAIAKAEGRNS